MKTARLPILLSIFITPALLADPSEEEIAFGKISGAEVMPSESKPLKTTALPEDLLAALRKSCPLSTSGDPDRATYLGFARDINKDGSPEYFIHHPAASGSTGPAYQLFSKLPSGWKRLLDYQGTLWVIPEDSGWPSLATVSPGGDGLWTKIYHRFKDDRFQQTLVVRYNKGTVSQDLPKQAN